MMKNINLPCFLACIFVLLMSATGVLAEEPPASIKDTRPPFIQRVLPKKGYFRIESGLSWLGYNNLSLPNDSTSNRFSLRPLLGSKAKAFSRFTYDVPFADDARGLRFVVAFLDDQGAGFLPQSALVAGKTFQAGVRASAFYRFNGYRGTYWWRLKEDENNLLRLGFTLNIREAKINLQQGALRGKESNIGVVPLLYFQFDHRLTDRLSVAFETDAFAIPGGRAVDANLRLSYALTRGADVLLGVRALDGLGDEHGDVYSSIRYYYTSLGVGFHF